LSLIVICGQLVAICANLFQFKDFHGERNGTSGQEKRHFLARETALLDRKVPFLRDEEGDFEG